MKNGALGPVAVLPLDPLQSHVQPLGQIGERHAAQVRERITEAHQGINDHSEIADPSSTFPKVVQ